MVIKERLKNPLFLSALISVFIIYSGLFNVPIKNRLQTIIPKKNISSVFGEINSSPVKSSSGKYYSCKLKCSSVSGENINTFFKSDAGGIINVYIPSEIVESLFPGKLYSKSKQNDIIESGTIIKLEGSFSDNEEDIFFAKNVTNYGFSNTSKIKKIRALARLQFKRLMYSWKDAGGLLLALLSGAREYTNTEVSLSFKNAGLSHILALSGMHLGMVSGIALFFGARLGRKKISYILQLLSVLLFVWFAGLSPSLLRAFICSVVLLIQRICNLDKSDMVYVLCFSFIAQTILSPNDLMNIGFILSYGALIGILLTSEFFTNLYSKVLPRRIALSFSASTGAQTFTMPISAKVFGKITPIGIVSSVFVSPLVTIFIYTGLALVIICLIFPSLVKVSGIFMQIQYTLISNMVGFFAKFPAINFI